MFGPRTKGTEGESRDNNTEAAPRANAEPHAQQSAPRMASPTIARRVVDMPGANRRPTAGNDAEKKLTVGKGLSLAGEITSCDILVVEGKVEAKLTDGKLPNPVSSAAAWKLKTLTSPVVTMGSLLFVVV